MDRKRPLILLSAAVIVALVTSLVAYKWIKKETDVREGRLQAAPAVVAATDLSWGTALNTGMVKTTPFLKGSLAEGEYFTDPKAIEGKILITPVKANEPILKSKLAPDTIASGGVAAVVDPKKRAMAVKVDKVIGVSGFVHPGNRVDVLVSLQKLDSKNQNPITKIVLQNIPVLATGTEIEQKGKNEKAVQVDVITLELMPEEAEKLALATTEGKIHLALRSYTSKEEISTRGATIPILLAGRSVPAPTAMKRAAPAKSIVVAKHEPAVRVEVFIGKEKSTKTFETEK